MYSRREIENIVFIQSNVYHLAGSRFKYAFTMYDKLHIINMLEEIQNYLLSKVNDNLFYSEDKYLQNKAGIKVSKFQESCANENWEYAYAIADNINKEVLSKTSIYKDFIKLIKTSPDYISTIRDKKFEIIFN